MKKTMVVLFLVALMLCSFNVFAQAQSSWSVKAGIDFGSQMDLDFPAELEAEGVEDDAFDTKMGYTIIGEYRMPYSDNINFGAGIAYQLNRELDVEDLTEEKADFGFTPFYGLMEYRMTDSPIYFVGHLGFASFRFEHPDVEDSSGGLYYALGGGMDFGESYEAEVLYTKNSGTVDFGEGEETYEVGADYSKFTVTFGMRF